MSVDTYLRGKDTSGYDRVVRDDVEVLLSPTLSRWSGGLHLGTRGAAFWRTLRVEVEHEHGPACQH